MCNGTQHTRDESDSESMRTTRRTALRGAGLAGVLAMGGGSAKASQRSSETNTHQAENETDETVPVTWENYTRAESDTYFASYAELGGFGEFYHIREPVPIDQQDVIQMNRDTLYSAGVFDLTEPVTVTQPDTGDRYQLLIVINQDHYVKGSSTTAGEYTLTQDEVGTRYCLVLVRTLVDPNDPDDVETVHAIQDEITASQRSPGTFEIPNWDQDSLEGIRNALITVGETMEDSQGVWGDADEVDPVKHFLGTAVGWGGSPETDEFVLWRTPERNDGDTPYTLTVEDVPVDGYWSVTVYNSDWYLEENEYDAYAINNVTAERADDGSVTIHFGGDPDQPNFLYTPAGWNYTVRLYEPRAEILDGSYQFPEAEPLE
ncbi:DUF1214 domain-containing protein [Haloterrigena sp. H1]|uniref:DUF1214 domain-containing protein n=1 Tax=Haloterrigena sp. H1 TaxID=2552943 RepID=UPI00110DCA42|nr:DUF1214 domain-containing protein [Haloterrigena sp. H1]TMT86297.1 DUF1214 domain-containing protein [Haloterrigena sp. H1]